MSDKWYSWYPGMGGVEILVQYDIKIRTNISNVTGSNNLQTIITLRWGEILCSGALTQGNILDDFILKEIKNNEEGSKHDLLDIYGSTFTVSMRRQLLCM